MEAERSRGGMEAGEHLACLGELGEPLVLGEVVRPEVGDRQGSVGSVPQRGTAHKHQQFVAPLRAVGNRGQSFGEALRSVPELPAGPWREGGRSRLGVGPRSGCPTRESAVKPSPKAHIRADGWPPECSTSYTAPLELQARTHPKENEGEGEGRDARATLVALWNGGGGDSNRPTDGRRTTDDWTWTLEDGGPATPVHQTSPMPTSRGGRTRARGRPRRPRTRLGAPPSLRCWWSSRR